MKTRSERMLEAVTSSKRTRENSKEATPVAKRQKEAPAKQQQGKEAPVKKQQQKEAPVKKQQQKEAPVKKQQQKEAPAKKQQEKGTLAVKQPEKEASAKPQVNYVETSFLPNMDDPIELVTIEPFTEERAVVTEQSPMKRATVTSVNIVESNFVPNMDDPIESNFEEWEVLGFLDARATEQLVDNVFTKSHKLCVHPNVPQLLKKEKTEKLYRSLYWAYLESTEKVQYIKTPLFGNNSEYDEMAVVTVEAIKKKTVITGLNGYLATVKNEVLEQRKELEFSVFGGSEVQNKTRIMLGPASFVNHDCNPNCRLVL